MLTKLEVSAQEKSVLKKKVKSLESDLSRVREEWYQKIEATKASYDRRISELEESIKILTKCIDKYEGQIGQHNDLKERIKLVQYQLSKVTKERDELKASIEKEAISVHQRELANQKKFESVYNKCKQTLELNKDLDFGSLVKNEYSPIKKYDYEHENTKNNQRQLYPEFNDSLSDKVTFGRFCICILTNLNFY